MVSALAFAAVPAAAQATDSIAAWRLSLGAEVGVPSGWVQVRENDIPGTRLRFGPDLRVRSARAYALGVAHRLGARTALDITLESLGLDGAVTLPRNVEFNGATLQQGTVARTATHFPHFLVLDAVVRRRVASFGDRGSVSLGGGMTFTALSFVLHGTLTAGSARHETSEDFLTQELPVPVLAASVVAPLGRRAGLFADLAGGYLPRVNSLRREGGEVTLTQTNARCSAGIQYDIGGSMQVAAGYAFRYFAQDEVSREDGNAIHLRMSAFMVRVARRF